jgi:small subunit ribosomal protein S8
MVNDPIGDLIVQLKNASMAKKKHISLPYSKMKHALCKLLVDEGYIETVEQTGDEPKTVLTIALRYKNSIPVITDLKRKSKPGLRVYVGKHAIPTVIGGMGIAVLSTPQGIVTGKEAKKRGIGGELLCEIW